jgi:dienelactone hydrolase
MVKLVAVTGVALGMLVQAAQAPATAADYAGWQARIRQALFIPEKLPALDVQTFGTFSPAAGVVAERVTYGTLYGMRVPAIVYRPESLKGGKLPGLVVVNGHSGDKTTWYAYYAGILYAKAGAVVVTYDPVGEDERNQERASDTRVHDTLLPGPEMPRRMGGQMVTDILQATAYLAARSDVDRGRIGVMAYSMGSFHAAIAGAIDPDIHALVLSGGGNLDGPGGYWDSPSKTMCQGGPYRALEALGDRGAVIYALNASRGATLVMNGTADNLIVSPHTDEAFFVDLRRRAAAITGSEKNLPETVWFEGAGHRPSFVTRGAVVWLNRQLHFANWDEGYINVLPEVRIREWSDKTGGKVGAAWQTEGSEWGVMALDAGVPKVPREQLQAVPNKVWQEHKDDYTWQSWAQRAQTAAMK